jgi:hypothetical protein
MFGCPLRSVLRFAGFNTAPVQNPAPTKHRELDSLFNLREEIEAMQQMQLTPPASPTGSSSPYNLRPRKPISYSA